MSDVVEQMAKAHCDFFGGEGWWDTGLLADTKPKALDAMRAAIAAVQVDAAPGWVPIETAPKDGIKAILYFPQDATDFDGVDYAYRLAIYRENAAFPLGAWCDQGTNHDSFEGPDMTGSDKASHWFPLPSAPTADREAVRDEQAAELAKFKALAEELATDLRECARALQALHQIPGSGADGRLWQRIKEITDAAHAAVAQYKEARDAS